MLNVEISENPSQNISITDEAGSRVDIVHVSCSIRPNAGLYLNLEVLNKDAVSENLVAVQEQLTRFLSDACARASDMGVPVPRVGGGSSA